MIVCVCNRISDREIARLARDGKGFDELKQELRIASCCGRCEDHARTVVAQSSTCQQAALLPDERSATTRTFPGPAGLALA